MVRRVGGLCARSVANRCYPSAQGVCEHVSVRFGDIINQPHRFHFESTTFSGTSHDAWRAAPVLLTLAALRRSGVTRRQVGKSPDLRNAAVARALASDTLAGPTGTNTDNFSRSKRARFGRWFKISLTSRWGAFALLILYFALSVLVYGTIEGWQPSDSIYFAVAALTTVGYGDLTLMHPTTRLFFCLEVLVALCVIATSISRGTQTFLNGEVARAQSRLLKELSPRLAMEFEGAVGIFNEKAIRRRRLRRFVGSVGALVVFVALSTVIARRVLQLSGIIDPLYFSIVTLTTVGFGDIVPKTALAKWTISLLCVVGVPIFGNMLARLGSLLHARETSCPEIDRVIGGLTATKFSTMSEFIQDMQEIGAYPKGRADDAADGSIGLFEFSCFLLVRNNVIGVPEIKSILDNFKELDIDNSGSLDVRDVEGWEKQCATNPMDCGPCDIEEVEVDETRSNEKDAS